jgi:hypothetical protein
MKGPGTLRVKEDKLVIGHHRMECYQAGFPFLNRDKRFKVLFPAQAFFS